METMEGYLLEIIIFLGYGPNYKDEKIIHQE